MVTDILCIPSHFLMQNVLLKTKNKQSNISREIRLLFHSALEMRQCN